MSKLFRSKRAFSLVESLFALAIVSVLLYYLFSSFLELWRGSNKIQGSLFETLLARTVLERVIDGAKSNPASIGQLIADPKFRKDDQTAEIWTAVAAKPSTIAAPPGGGTILPPDASPFFKNILGAAIAASGETPGTSSNEIVQKAFQDYVMKMQVSRRPASNWGSAELTDEITTIVTVEVYRVSQRNGAGDVRSVRSRVCGLLF